METLREFFQFITNSEEIIQTGGLLVIVLIVFIENGLFFGFFLPGDYLLFLSGVFCGLAILKVHIFILVPAIFAAAVLGSSAGYFSGYYFGESIELKEDNLFFKKKYISRTRKYFDKYGSRTLVIARFLPIIRTFAPIMAGVVKMRIFPFMLYNVVGGGTWVFVLVCGGYYLGQHFPWIINYVHYIVIFFIAITTVTVIRGYFSAKKEIEEA
ncbi:DedA family protein [Marinilongibacter aquaticus]|uniref:DedA family protein n=1 Tax=Marinilongibacter aquaticus TaxID=2975157 RepID=UPI0021BD8A30|nr:DedA family protein [Marinilongibacter aquaticus]UBM60353.1 DedA family protein [Marinilongibacter aquaticus]